MLAVQIHVDPPIVSRQIETDEADYFVLKSRSHPRKAVAQHRWDERSLMLTDGNVAEELSNEVLKDGA